MGDVPTGGSRRPQNALDLTIGFDGSLRLFCGRAADTPKDVLRIMESIIAEQTVRLLAFAGLLYEPAGYLGPVDIGVAITGILGARSHGSQLHGFILDEARGYEHERYRRCARVLSTSLAGDPLGTARGLSQRFFRAVTRGFWDPLDPPVGQPR